LAALEEMLLHYAGSALVISHDRWFLDRIATSILAFEGDGRMEWHAGNYSEYRERKAAETVPVKEKTKTIREKPAPKRTTQRSKKLSFKEERELQTLLSEIEADEGQIQTLESRLADPETYKNNGSEIKNLQIELNTLQEQVLEKMARWEDLEARSTGG